MATTSILPERLCAHCHVWRLSDDDTYCSWCGQKLFDLAVDREQVPRQVFQDRLPPQPVRLVVRNVGQVPLGEVTVTSSVDWLEVSQGVIEELEAAAERNVLISFVLDEFPDGYEQAQIVVGSKDLQQTIEIDLHPPVRLIAELTGGPVRLRGKKTDLAIEIRAVVGQAELVAIADGAVPWCLFSPREHWPFQVSSGLENAARVTATVDEAQLAAHLAETENGKRRPGESRRILLPVSVRTRVDEAVPLTDLSFDVVVPPTARLLNAQQMPDPSEFFVEVDEIYCGGTGEVRVGLRNVGDEELLLESVDIDRDSSEWLSIVGTLSLPCAVSSGVAGSEQQLSALTFKIDAETATAGQELTGRVRLVTNDDRSDHITVIVSTVPKALRDYTGTLAVDFGTTNSCVMHQAPGDAAPAVVPLEPLHSGRVAPSVVLYQALPSDGPREYEVGLQARQYLRDPSASASLVTSAKRGLGHSREYSVWGLRDRNRQKLAAGEVCADIIAFLVKATESHIRKRVTDCVITHPVRFSWAQVDELKRAFEACGVSVASTLPEPVAAGLDFIRDWPQPEYSLLVCDLGGGTSDLSLFKVTRTSDDGTATVIKPILLGADTDNWFGGDDVTRACVEEIKRCVEQDHGITLPLCAPDKRIFVRDPAEAENGVKNWFVLWTVAEAAKMRLSADGGSIDGGVPLFDLAGQVSNYTWSLNLSAIEDIVRPDFLRLVEMSRALFKRAKERQAIETLDVILMAGNASQFPMARAVMEDAFSQTGFADKLTTGMDVSATSVAGLKECVASGACWLRAVERFGGSIEIDASGLRVATTCVAVMVADPNPGPQPVIHVGDELNSWVPFRKYKPTQTVQIIEDAGGGDLQEIVTFEPGRHLDFSEPVTLHLLLDEQSQVWVRLIPEAGEPRDYRAAEILNRS